MDCLHLLLFLDIIFKLVNIVRHLNSVWDIICKCTCNTVEDEYSSLPFPSQHLSRLKNRIFTTKKSIEEPFSDKLLPDPLEPPYYQPKYTIAIYDFFKADILLESPSSSSVHPYATLFTPNRHAQSHTHLMWVRASLNWRGLSHGS